VGVFQKIGSLAPFFELTPKTMLVNMPSNYTKNKSGSTSLGASVGASSWGGGGGGGHRIPPNLKGGGK